MRTFERLALCLAILPVLMLSACGGVIDRDPSGLNAPPGGWDNPKDPTGSAPPSDPMQPRPLSR